MIAPSSTGRMPNRRIRGVVTGFTAMLPRNREITTRPARAADQPKPSWRNTGSRNGMALITARKTEPPNAVTR